MVSLPAAEPARLTSRHGGPRQPWRPRLASLKARMAFVVVAVLLPPFLYAVWLAVNAYAEPQRQQAARLETALRVVARYELDYLRRVERLLAQIAIDGAGLAEDPLGCAGRLGVELERAATLTNLLLLDGRGAVICSARPLREPAAFGERRFFNRLRDGATFAVSDLLMAPDDGGPGIFMAVPWGQGAGATTGGALAASIELATYNRALASLELPQGAAAFVIDSRGQLVAAEGYDEALLRALPAQPSLEALIGQPPALPGGRTYRGADGIERGFVVGDIAFGNLSVLVGIPAPGRWAWLQRDLVIGIFLPTLMLALAVAAIWIAVDYLVSRHVRELVSAARAFSRGELERRPPRIEEAPAELRELADTFATMAQRIRHRETELTSSLAQKDTLIRELHHRVKNNLQIVTSLLNLRVPRIAAPDAREAIREAQLRIRALALVHRHLYDRDEVALLELAPFVRELCDLLAEAHLWDNAEIQLVPDIEPLEISPDQAVPLAILIVEAVSNAFRHAFPDGRSGTIILRLGREGADIRLQIKDDGVGRTTASPAGSGTGLSLMAMFAKQIGGSIRYESADGFAVDVVFPAASPMEPSAPEGVSSPASGQGEAGS
jgi:two-component sensor histidine kinase